MRSNWILFSIFLLFSCQHPESTDFKRNIKPTSTQSSEKKTDQILKMEIENGVKYVWVEINGINLRFVFDTGASNICISEKEAQLLYDQGTLTAKDILDVQLFQDATGMISEGIKINLKKVKIGDQILENVEALVVNNSNAPLLLGQTALERFGNIEIDNLRGCVILKN